MGLFSGRLPSLNLPILPARLKGQSLRTKLLLTLIPPVVGILVVTGYVNYDLSYDFLNIALERNVRVQTLAMRHEVEAFLHECRKDILFIAQGPAREDSLRDFLANTRKAGGTAYRELAFLSLSDDNHIFLVIKDGRTLAVPAGDVERIAPNPLLETGLADGLAPGEVSISDILDVEYPLSPDGGAARRISTHIIRFSTLCRGPGGARGLLTLGVDVSRLRDILSVYNSPQSPLWAFPRSDEVRYAYLFDPDGWILFQSEDPDRPETPLTTYLARSGFEGTLGRPGLSCAFRPSSIYGNFWKMISDVVEKKNGLVRVSDGQKQSSTVKDYYFSYSPVMFDPGGGREPRIYGGVAFVDRTRLTLAAGYKYLDSMFVIALGTTVVISIIIFVLGHYLTSPLVKLATAVQAVRLRDGARRIDLPTRGRETEQLKDAVNHLISVMQRQVEEIRIKDETIKNIGLMERASLEDEIPFSPDIAQDLIPEIVGIGPKIVKIKNDIMKAAQANVDVMIIGETGTGKQLAAEAVHAHSARSERPIIAINCGALDENLLLDTLFGHVKGAFTEARSDRKGAFLQADGGTLFLDEIQAASPKVQQSLLRAIEMRKIKPLGSDKELDVDVRLIAATNVDLTKAIEKEDFREDLFFRLRVISIFTPPLRHHVESIPSLAMRFLADAEAVSGKDGLCLSKGALEKLKHHHWPGNIRELKNCITMAAVMAEGTLIQASDIPLADDACPSLRRTGAAPLGGPEDEAVPASGVSSGDHGPGRGEHVPPRAAVNSDGAMAKTDDAWIGGTSADVGRNAAAPGPLPGPQRSERGESVPPESFGESSSAARPARTPESPPSAPSSMQSSAPSPAKPSVSSSGPDNESVAVSTPKRATAKHPVGETGAQAGAVGSSSLAGLNPRQATAWPGILAQGRTTRTGYQELAGGDISPRTALYDLQDLVKRGVLIKTGRGPATRYVVAGK